MTTANFYKTILGRLGKGPRLGLLLGLLLARAAWGTDALYENPNYGVVDYTGAQGTYPPVIDATSFDNEGTFTIDWSVANFSTQPAYETSNTINYTNTGLMSSDIGFLFDTQTTDVIPRKMAGSFYNSGTIDCGYPPPPYLPPPAFQFLTLNRTVGFTAWATNIVNPGNVNVPGVFMIVNQGTGATGVGGLLQITGQNVDLTGSVLTIAGGQGTGHAIGLLGLIGTDTNLDWDPTFDLGPTYAYPSYPVSALPAPPNGFGFPNLPLNTTPYFNFAAVGTNLVIIRTVFIQDTSPNVSYNVYFDAAGLGSGTATVEWRGGYVDPATGNPATNYLYLNNNYLLSVATNDPIANGIPGNFTFTESTTPLIALAPTAPGFFNVFTPGFQTNPFAYVSAQLIATSAGTNSIVNRAITNLPSRIQISASRELNLALAQIGQPDYLSLQSSNQFDGNPGARIAAPFSDLNLGATNGFLTISNLLPQAYPLWSGKVQAWSTRWLVVNTAIGVTNDYRVLLVASQLNPTTSGQIQDLILHGTNSIVISDAYTVLRKLSIDARSLTLTTNGIGNGPTSADGELNFASSAIVWTNSLPNLRWLTNNGVISTLNLANFGSSAMPYGAFVNRGGVFNSGGSIIWANDFESSGTFFSGTGTSFVLQSQTTTLTNGSITAGGDIAITTGSLVTSNLTLAAGRSLTLQVTNLLTDGFFLTNGFNPNTTNLNLWSVGAASLVGLSLPLLPNNPTNRGDLLGTTISVASPTPNKQVVNTWAGQDRGASGSGYMNNEAVGVLILDAKGVNSAFLFNGAGVSNALYVDRLDLRDYASYTNHNSGGNLPALAFNTNLVIYYADAIAQGAGDVSFQLNHKNSDHLRWVPTYAGYFSSTNLVFGGATNTVNVALAQSTVIDSDGDGTQNASDPTPFFLRSMIPPVIMYQTNPPSGPLAISWNSIPNATNFVFYSTTSPSGPFTNLLTGFSTNISGPFTMSNFISPIPYPSPASRVMIFTPVPGSLQYYQPAVSPWQTYPY